MSAPTMQPESPHDAFARLLGLGTDQKLADTEVQALMAIKEKLKLDGTDAMWQVLQALHYYDRLYRTYPKAIKDAAVTTLEHFRQTANAEAEKTKNTVQRSLTAAVAEASRNIAVNTARKELVRQCIIGAAIAVVLTLFATGFAFWKGTQSGYNKGLAEAAEQKAVASWANTDSGRKAWKLWKIGEIDHLTNCDKDGWKRDKSDTGAPICTIGRASDGNRNWWVLPN